jgi:DNA primase catalytic core
MARIPDTEIERLKSEVSLLRLVEAAGIELKRQGKDWVGRCPFHDDRTPSLMVSPEKNLWHCLGACDVGGTVIDWTMRLHGVSFRHAVELLREQPSSLAAEAEPVKTGTVRKLASEAPFAADADDVRLLERVTAYYHTRLKEVPAALDYLKARGLDHPELINTFRLGVADRTLAYRLPQKNRAEGEAIRTRLQKLGVLRESGHEHLNGSLVVPLFDEAGNVVQLYGRKLLDNLRAGTAYHLYLPGEHRGVFNREGLRGAREVILCEALIDAMSFWCAGFRNVTSAYGVNGFTDELLACFQAQGVERVLIAFDRDEAGNAGAERVAKQLEAAGMSAFRVLFPKGMDANEYACKVTPAHKSLEIALRKAEWMCGVARARAVTPAQEAVPEEATTPSASEPPPRIAEATASPLAAEAAAGVAAPAAVSGADVTADVSEHEVTLRFDERHYRVRGLSKNLSHELLKINLLVRQGNAFHVDTLDLYNARARAAYVKQAAQELGLSEEPLKADLGAVLLKLEELQDKLIRGVLTQSEKAPAMSDEELKSALGLLQSPDLMRRILSDFARCGVVGEEANKQVAYLAAVSRKLEKPLAVMVQSSSAAGKSSLMDAVLRFMPEEERVQYSAMTGQSLFYLGEKDLKHKILAISEEEGAHHASYALKLLQSEGVVSIASTGKNAVTGNLETQEYRVEGPVMLFSTTTAIDLDEELLNRCLVLAVDESREQTQAIHAEQRKRRTLEGLRAAQDKQRLVRLHQNAQRLLRPLKVVNPYAERLTFLSDKTRTRRDHEKYLALIDALALLHQHQRDVKREIYEGAVIEYVEVSLSDLEQANALAHEVLGRTLDELPPQTRRLLQVIAAEVAQACARERLKQADYRFSRKQVRRWSGWTDFQVKKHMQRLEAMEYVLIHRGRRGQSFEYELLYQGEGEQGDAFLMGLIDVAALYDEKKKPPTTNKEPSGRPQAAAEVPRGSGDENRVKPKQDGLSRAMSDTDDESEISKNRSSPSYRSGIASSLVAAAGNADA